MMDGDNKNGRLRSVPKVLVTGAGTGRANNLVRSLKTRGDDLEIIGCHSDIFVLAKSDTDWRFKLPSPSSGLPFVMACRALVEKWPIDLVIPSSDEDAFALAKIRDQLPSRLFLPPEEVIALC